MKEILTSAGSQTHVIPSLVSSRVSLPTEPRQFTHEQVAD